MVSCGGRGQPLGGRRRAGCRLAIPSSASISPRRAGRWWLLQRSLQIADRRLRGAARVGRRVRRRPQLVDHPPVALRSAEQQMGGDTLGVRALPVKQARGLQMAAGALRGRDVACRSRDGRAGGRTEAARERAESPPPPSASAAAAAASSGRPASSAACRSGTSSPRTATARARAERRSSRADRPGPARFASPHRGPARERAAPARRCPAPGPRSAPATAHAGRTDCPPSPRGRPARRRRPRARRVRPSRSSATAPAPSGGSVCTQTRGWVAIRSSTCAPAPPLLGRRVMTIAAGSSSSRCKM